MAKRTSKKALSPETIKEEPAIKKDILSESKTPEAAKEKAVNNRSNSKKPDPPKSRKKTTVVDLADMEKIKPAPRRASAKALTKVEKEKPEKKPVFKTATAGKVSIKKENQPALRKASSLSAVKPALRSVYSNSKHTLLVLGFGSDFNTKKSVVIFSDLLTGQVYTIALSIWNRWKLREVKKINTET